MSHLCHANNCIKEVPPKMFMCLKHWKMVPKNVQADIWKNYRRGQEIDKRPTKRYLYVTGIAKYMVLLQENKCPPENFKPIMDEFRDKLKSMLGIN